MIGYSILDTFPAFDRLWSRIRTLPIDQQIEIWRRDYLRPCPELFRKQVSDYQDQGEDWRAVARRRIFPSLGRELPRMRRVRTNIRRAIPLAVRRCGSELGMDFPVSFVIHVGIGCGAGWATSYAGEPAILLGVENATERRWEDSASTVAMIGHELAHLVHSRWRNNAGLGPIEEHGGPWWQLYTEGFATRCEQIVGGRLGDRSRDGREDWLVWCQRNRARLAKLLLKALASHRSIRRFFGSWYDVDGYIETGYFLGSEVIHDWESHSSLRDIACWTPDRVRRKSRAALQRMAR